MLKKPPHDDVIEAKEVYSQQSFGRYKGKLVLRNLSPSVYLDVNNNINIFNLPMGTEQGGWECFM